MEVEENVGFIVAEKSNPIVVSTNCKCETRSKWDRVAFQRQLLAASGAIIGSISFGMTTGFSATLLPKLSKYDSSSFLIDDSSESWIASSVVLSMLVGVVNGGFSMRCLGRKKAQICFYVPWICGWIWISYASDMGNLILGCVLMGFGAGSHSVVTFIYIGETAEPRFRGLISAQIALGVTFGILLSHLLGILLDWRTALRIGFVLPAVAFALALFAPESPTWLILHGRLQKAKKTFLWLRNDAPECENEFDAMINGTVGVGRARTTDGIVRGMFSKGFLKAFLVLNLIFVVQQSSGLNVIVFYAVKIFDAMPSHVDASSSLIVVDTVRLFASLAACVLIKMVGRRKLLFWSVAGTLLSLAGVIVCILCQLASIVLVIFTCAYIWFLYVGLAPIPWVMVGELYPANLKEVGSCMSSFFVFLLMFVVVKTAPFLMAYLGTALLFTLYGTIVTVGVIVLYFIMPETNNITLQQVEENMRN